MAAKQSKPAAFSAFISHAKADAKKAQAIAEGLEARGFKCWIAPRDVKAGRTYGDEIIRGIEGAKAFILVLSKASNGSTFVAREVERAVSKGKPVLALRIANVEPGPALELFVASTQWIDAFPGRLTPHIDRLAERLAEEEGIEPPESEGKASPPRRVPKWAIPAGAAASVLLLIGLGFALWPAQERPTINATGADLVTKPVWVDGSPSNEKEQVAGVRTHDFETQSVEGALDRPALPQDPDYQSCDKDTGAAAIAACDRAIYSGKFAGRDLAFLYNDRGYLYMVAGDLDRGRADLDRAITLDPEIYHPYWNRAEILRHKGDSEGAVADYQKALALGPKGDDKSKIEASLAALAREATSQAGDPSVITAPTWGDEGERAASVPAYSYPADAMPAYPASPPMAVTPPPPMPASPPPMPVR